MEIVAIPLPHFNCCSKSERNERNLAAKQRYKTALLKQRLKAIASDFPGVKLTRQQRWTSTTYHK